jgi:hypothetical protein
MHADPGRNSPLNEWAPVASTCPGEAVRSRKPGEDGRMAGDAVEGCVIRGVAVFFRPARAAVVAFARMPRLNPNGIPSQSPRLCAPRCLGNTVQSFPRPQRGCGSSITPKATTPSGLMLNLICPPGVAPRESGSDQPRAGGRNPFGIEAGRFMQPSRRVRPANQGRVAENRTRESWPGRRRAAGLWGWACQNNRVPVPA